MTPRASRSLTEPSGLKASIFTKRLMPAGASLLILTTGVLPTVSRMLAYRCPTEFASGGPSSPDGTKDTGYRGVWLHHRECEHGSRERRSWQTAVRERRNGPPRKGDPFRSSAN